MSQIFPEFVLFICDDVIYESVKGNLLIPAQKLMYD
jgi:hypothetical protein